MDESAAKLVEFTLRIAPTDLDAHVLHQAKRRVLDSIGCALGGYTTPPARIARRLALPVSSGGARVFGSLVPTTPDHAAFANGVMTRYLDFNDSGLGGGHGSHPSDNLGGVLAVAESVHASGADFLLALTISYEVQSRVMDSAPFHKHGWDQPVAGVLGCALACGRLLGLDSAQLHHAVALAVIPNLCTFQSRAGTELSMWKGCAAANGARQGVFAAQLASHGMTGPTDPFDGTYGLWAQTVGQRYQLKPLGASSEPLAITQSAIKKFPVRNSCQTPVETALDLRRRISPGDIAEIWVETYQSAYDKTASDKEQWAPRTRETADHSLPFAVAVALLDGEITPGTFNRERYLDPDVLGLIEHMRVSPNPDFTREFGNEVQNCRIVARSRSSGNEVASHLRFRPEEIIEGPSDVELEAKFTELTRDSISASDRQRLFDALWQLEAIPDVTRLIDLLRI
jgi:2-methylcitrate dehydratase